MLKLPNYQTWIVHGLVAGVITAVLPLFGMTPFLAASFAVYGYAFREADQIIRKEISGVPHDWLDHILDVAVPLVVSALVVWAQVV